MKKDKLLKNVNVEHYAFLKAYAANEGITIGRAFSDAVESLRRRAARAPSELNPPKKQTYEGFLQWFINNYEKPGLVVYPTTIRARMVSEGITERTADDWISRLIGQRWIEQDEESGLFKRTERSA